jgi:CRISPR system Cascade subunit CasB
MSETPSPSQVAERARAWWRDLQPADERGQAKEGDRAALARLRRCATPADAMVEEATLTLFRRLGLKATDHHRLPQVALIAMVLAHVRADAASDADGFRPAAARAIGRASLEDEDSAKMSVLRFRRLLSARDEAELAQQMRRLVALADGRVNVGDLAASLLFWGDKVRQRWTFEYYAAGAAAPRDAAPDAASANASAL